MNFIHGLFDRQETLTKLQTKRIEILEEIKERITGGLDTLERLIFADLDKLKGEILTENESKVISTPPLSLNKDHTNDIDFSSSLKRLSPDELRSIINKTSKQRFTCSDLCLIFKIAESTAYRYILKSKYGTKKGCRWSISKDNLLSFIDSYLLES